LLKDTFATKLQTKRLSLNVINNAGLAGLRVGYGAFPLSIIEYLWRAKQPYNVSVAAEVSACAALQNPTYLEVLLLQSHCNNSFHSSTLPNLTCIC
jgi:histidinol-phosphate/aromatic aminotransferase/cobyric acid decarboxylase-like protein